MKPEDDAVPLHLVYLSGSPNGAIMRQGFLDCRARRSAHGRFPAIDG